MSFTFDFSDPDSDSDVDFECGSRGGTGAAISKKGQDLATPTFGSNNIVREICLNNESERHDEFSKNNRGTKPRSTSKTPGNQSVYNVDLSTSKRLEDPQDLVHQNQDVDPALSLLSKEVVTFYEEDALLSNVAQTSLDFCDVCLKIIDTSCLENAILKNEVLQESLKSSNILKALASQSDLVSGNYEGGLKIWECGVDLANFLSSHPIGEKIAIEEKCVLEVGCGVGLPGLYSMKKGAKSVHFQDYNEEVLKLLTHPNVTLNSNTCKDSPSCTCRYYSGDWDSFTDLVNKENLKYDIILTAETIYNESSYAKLHNLFDTLLEKGGKIILAAKTYYFGVGGNVTGFCEFVNGLEVFTVEEVHSIQSGVPRKILLLERKDHVSGSDS